MSTFEQNPPKIELLAYTPRPLKLMYEVWARAKSLQQQGEYIEDPGPFDDWVADHYELSSFVALEGVSFTPTPMEILRERHHELVLTRRQAEENLFTRLIYDYTQIPEMVSFAWWLEGVPRAFFDQAVRHRKTSMFARSQRVEENLGHFYKQGGYLTTPEIATDPLREAIYREAMENCAVHYSALIALGVPVEDARGLLPLHLRTGFAWGTTLRDLAEIFRKRTCHLLQQTYWAPVMRQMRQAVVKVDPALGVLFAPPCERGAGCVSTHDAELRYNAVVGGRADLHPCKLWTEKFATSDQRTQLVDAVKEGRTRWALSAEDAK